MMKLDKQIKDSLASKNLKQDVSLQNQILSDKAVKILANSIYQSLREEGIKNKDIIGVSSQLIGLVSSSLTKDKF